MVPLLADAFICICTLVVPRSNRLAISLFTKELYWTVRAENITERMSLSGENSKVN